MFSTGRNLRPAMTGALAVLMLIGGGTGVGIYEHNNTVAVASPSPAVNDLKILDNNAQAIQQMNQLLDDSASTVDDTPGPPS